MIPAFDSRGSLPPGVYETTLAEIEERFGFNDHRKCLNEGLKEAIITLQSAGVRRVWIDGSFVTNKPDPDDVDGGWDPVGADLDVLDPVLLEFARSRGAMKEKYGVDFFPNVVEGESGKLFYRFFQYDRDLHQRGILLLNLGGDQ